MNICFLDMSKAFDKVKHSVLYLKLMKNKVPATLIRILISWYNCSEAFVRWGSSISYVFKLSCGVRQGGVLSPILFSLYVNDIIVKLKESKLGCCVDGMYIGCILYADDIVLLSPSLYTLQKMINICLDEAVVIDMKFNPRKSAIMRVGSRYNTECEPILIDCNPIEFVNRAKYLGIYLLSSKSFKIHIHESKVKFFRAFNGLYHKCALAKPETVILELVNSYCKPHLLYGIESLNLLKSEINKLSNAWTCAISKIFHVTGDNVNTVCKMFDELPFFLVIALRKMNFLFNLKSSTNKVLYHMYCIIGCNELNLLAATYNINMFIDKISVKNQLLSYFWSN